MSQAAIHTRPDAHAAAFDLCAKGHFSVQQAIVMAGGFATRGQIDAHEGCFSYALHLMVYRNLSRQRRLAV
ncbi:hypothetical protein AB4Y45_33045 [Paraburkholderia sp. EG287A]|uniref:hypothetical protein n=1 Tax=Paraburkholderia sp. EG287A TaxID=3237012 RepID=UPI0034D39168